MEEAIARWREDPKRLLIISAVVGIGVALFMIGKLVLSGFSILDDHTIAAWLGPHRHVGLSDFWRMFDSTELGQYGTGYRYRPFMYLLIIFETLAWGTHPAAFHAVAVIWLCVFLWAVAWASFRTIGFIGGFGILFLIANGGYWGNIFTHSTMPSEQPAAMGLGLIIFGFGLLFSWFVKGDRRRIDVPVLLVVVGGFVCVGSKEDFMPMLALDILVVAAAARLGQIGRLTLAICILLILLDIAICYGIVVPNIGKPVDMYGVDNSIGYRLRTIPHSRLFPVALVALVSGAAAATWGWQRRRVRNDVEARSFLVLGALLVFSGLYLSWEIFFYSGRLPAGQRYDFPALLIFPILAGAALWVANFCRARIGWLRQRFSPLAVSAIFGLLILNVATAYYVHGSLFRVRDAIKISNDHTGRMRAALERSKALTAPHPDWPVIVIPAQPMNAEAVVTLPIWLQFFEISNPATVLVQVPENEMKTDFERALVKRMRFVSEHGQQDRQGAPYRPMSPAIEKAIQQGHCYVVEFGVRTTSCIALPYTPNEYNPVD